MFESVIKVSSKIFFVKIPNTNGGMIMSKELIEFLDEQNNFLTWVHLRKSYEGNFDDEDFKMFDKYAYFYDIPYKVMNVVIYLGMDRYNMDSSKLVDDLNDICKLLQKNKVETVREAVYFFKLYDTNHMEIIKTLDDLSKRIEKLESREVNY